MQRVGCELPDGRAVDAFNRLAVQGVGRIGRDGERAVVGAVADGSELVMVEEIGAHVGVVFDGAIRAEVPVLHENHARPADAIGRRGANRRAGDGAAANRFLRLCRRGEAPQQSGCPEEDQRKLAAIGVFHELAFWGMMRAAVPGFGRAASGRGSKKIPLRAGLVQWLVMLTRKITWPWMFQTRYLPLA